MANIKSSLLRFIWVGLNSRMTSEFVVMSSLLRRAIQEFEKMLISKIIKPIERRPPANVL